MNIQKKILILIILFSLFTRLYRLDYPRGYVFDEVYHAFTAKEYLKGSKKAWEWWTTPPPGVAYEWTHPPLAKEVMAISMFILRTQDSWAYRLPGVLMGVLSILLVYLLGLKLLKNERAALIAAFIFSIDGINFVQSRTGMNDIYLVTFILASLLLFLKKNYFISAICVGLALCSKWAALYLLTMIILLLIKDHQLKKILFFLLIPPIIYLALYLPFFLLGHNFSQFLQLQQQMWWYHTNLKATHSYSSPWWSWPFNLYPVWYFVQYQGEKVANIFLSGNPAVFWAGSVSIMLTTWELFRKKSIKLLPILLGFFIFWLPWAISPRIMFLYHFSPSVPFLSLAMGYQLSINQQKNKILVVILLVLFLINFALIFPFLTGVPTPKDLTNLFFESNLSKNPFSR